MVRCWLFNAVCLHERTQTAVCSDLRVECGCNLCEVCVKRFFSLLTQGHTVGNAVNFTHSQTIRHAQMHLVKCAHLFHRTDTGTLQHTRGFLYSYVFFAHRRQRRTTIWPKMNAIVFNKLSSRVLFEDKAKEVEMSSRNYLEVIDEQHPDLLSGSQTIRDNQTTRHRRGGYVELSAVFSWAV